MMRTHIQAFFFTALCLLASMAKAEQEAQQLQEITIYGDRIQQGTAKSAQPATVLSGDDLRTKTGQTIGETLQNEPGISNQSFGAGVGSPVIRGQSGNRVRILQNSIGSNDLSSLSPDHATGVDPVIAERVEVLRGPSSLLYSNGAIGGIVNVIDNRIPEAVPDKLIGGAGEQRYDSATNEAASALKMEGGKGQFAYHTDGFYRDQNNTHIGGVAIDEAAARRHDPSFNAIAPGELVNTKGFIGNSQARSRGGSVGGSFITDGGLVGAAVNSLEKTYGIPPDGHGEAPVVIDLNQMRYDFKGQLNRPFEFAEDIRFKFGYTDYEHFEIEGGTIDNTFLNETFESRLELNHKPIAGLDGVIGFQSVNSQFEAIGTEGQIVPKSNIESYAVFAAETFKHDKLSFDVGVRAEFNRVDPSDRGSKAYVPISGSVSGTWQINDQHQLNLAFTHSERAPQVQELFSDGFHHATRSYERGNAGLSKELSNNLDISYRFNADWVNAEFNLFHNWVNNYIYLQRSSTELFDEESERIVATNADCDECFPVLNTQQTGATFKGFEAQATFPLMQNAYGALDLTVFGDITRGKFNNGADVPRMPPLRYGLQLSYEKDAWFANARLTRAEAQTNPGDNETPTDSYLLFNVSGQYKLTDFYGTDVLLFAKGKNLLNENIRNSVSYLRNFAPEPGRGAEIGVRLNY